ncbi:hypothetical protein VTK73DRAFT_1059 [Phialemonium thermophilum]|uniref:ATP synthase protein MI25 n=1 Tax=Phialemonium thermophilum TaxID=223376 RepID=A0ABR3VTY1_9PEZI
MALVSLASDPGTAKCKSQQPVLPSRSSSGHGFFLGGSLSGEPGGCSPGLQQLMFGRVFMKLVRVCAPIQLPSCSKREACRTLLSRVLDQIGPAKRLPSTGAELKGLVDKVTKLRLARRGRPCLITRSSNTGTYFAAANRQINLQMRMVSPIAETLLPLRMGLGHLAGLCRARIEKQLILRFEEQGSYMLRFLRSG